MTDTPQHLPPDESRPGDPETERVTIRPADTGRRRPPTQARPATSRHLPDVDTPRSDDAGHIISPHVPVMPQFGGQEPTPLPARPRRGCGLPLLGIALVILPLIVLALFLPPFSLWDRLDERLNGSQATTPDQSESGAGLAFTALAPDAPQISADGLVVAVPPEDLTAPFAVHVAALAPSEYQADRLPREGWFCASGLPDGYTTGSTVFSLAQQGTPPNRFTLSVTALPEDVTDGGALQLFVWDAAAARWEFVAGGADETGTVTADLSYLPRCVTLLREMTTARRLGLALGPTDATPEDLTSYQARIFQGSVRPTLTGALQVVLAPGVRTRSGYPVLPLVQNFDDPAVIDNSTVEIILNAPAVRSEHAKQIAAFVLSDSFAGVAIDYRVVPADLRDSYTALIRELADLMHAQNHTVTVMVPMPSLDAAGAVTDTGGYDWHALGLIADEIVIGAPLDPHAYASGAAVDQALAWATTVVARSKLTLGLSASSAEDQNGTFAPVSLQEAVSALGAIVIQPSGDVPRNQSIVARLVNPAGITAQSDYDAASGTPSLRYLAPDGSVLRTMWITSASALDARLARARDYSLGGVYVRDTFAPGAPDQLDEALAAYRQGRPAEGLSPELDFRWLLVGLLSGNQIADVPTQPNQPFAYGLWPSDGTYTLGAWLEGVIVDSATVTVVLPPPAATPIPDATETPVPTATLTPSLTLTHTAAPTTAAPTATETPTASPTPPPTATLTPPPTLTVTRVIALLPSTTPVPPTLAPSATPTLTATPSPEPSNTPVPTATATATFTPTATSTATATPTATPSPQPSDTPVPTATATATFTPPPPTATATPAAPPTATVPGPEGVQVVPLPGQPLTAPAPTPTTPPESGVVPTRESDAIDFAALPTVDPAILAAGQIGTAFEAGVSAAALNRSLLFAGRAHFTWLALDVRYQLGATPGAQQRVIDDAHANGFKVLLTVTGDPAEFDAIPRADYIAQYAAYVSGLASYGADGIEIWREMNGQMPAADYVWLLALSYDAIKTSYPGVLVITGALTPTPAAVLEEGDNVYYQRMAELGADRFADCIGAEYLLGAVPPINASGDPRGDNPVYYLPSAMDRAWNAFNDHIPVCYTRFGYLSPEGYASLPEEYAWAQNTSAAQQADWLAQAVQLSMEGAQVRLLIAWTLDATGFAADDPLAGYALVRPDDTCPACDALGLLLVARGAGVE